jgi:7,8-dihydropterin-6-yl-methyl-4-(beta-D-ribofuranosyl)aminobenzene 5'-phosphate synthase
MRKGINLQIMLVFGAVFLGWCLLFNQARAEEKPGESGAVSRLTYIYGDREVLKSGCQRAWGLVTLIEFDGKHILFDTGGDRDILKNNMQILGIDPKSLDLIVISHEHWEMLDGVPYLLENNPQLPIYTTDVVVREMGQTELFQQRNWSDNLKGVNETLKLTPNIILMKLKSRPRHGGPFGIEEVHIVLKTKQGLVILQGCGHPEIVNIMERSRQQTGEKRVYLISGGTRMLDPGKVVKLPGGGLFSIPQPHPYSDEDVAEIADKLLAAGVQHIVRTHCTGDRAEKILARKFGDKYINEKLGMTISLPPPLLSP